MSGLVCWLGEAWSLFSSIVGGTDVVLIVELVQSFFHSGHRMFVLFSIFIELRCAFFILIYNLLALPVKPVRGNEE